MTAGNIHQLREESVQDTKANECHVISRHVASCQSINDTLYDGHYFCTLVQLVPF